MATVTVALKDDTEGEWYSFLLSPEEETRLSQDPEFASLLLNSVKKNKVNNISITDLTDQQANHEIQQQQQQQQPSTSQDMDIISEVQDDSEEKFTWSYQSVIALLNLFRMHKDRFVSPEMKKKNVWKEISKKMQEQGYLISAEQCDKKWRNLRATYKAVLCKKSRKPGNKKTWEFFMEMHDICQDDPGYFQDTITTPTNSLKATVVGNNPNIPIIQIVQAGGSSGNILRRSLQDMSAANLTTTNAKKRKTNVTGVGNESNSNNNGDVILLQSEPQNTIEPEWFLQYKRETRIENERNMQEIKSMHNENMKLLKDRNDILKNLVRILSEDRSDDASEILS